MTLIFERPVVGPKTHAFVVGVGDYPDAKSNRGYQDDLRKVPDLPSAADSAKLMCDWLCNNQDKLAAPLATLEVLISDPNEQNNRYGWAQRNVGPATQENVIRDGGSWFDRLLGEQDSVAFFYCCGHGASHLQQPILFLGDLNKYRDNAWTHINLALIAQALRKAPTVKSAFMFSDACGEFVTKMELRNPPDCRFFPEDLLFGRSRNQVSLMCAAAEAQPAYEGANCDGGNLNFGRFTQAVLKGLDGSSARLRRDKWGVDPRGLLDDLKSLQRVYFQHWGDKLPFEPYQAVTQTDIHPIVFHDSFELPVVVITDPEHRMPDYGLFISDHNDPSPPWLKSRDPGPSSAWLTSVAPGQDILYAIAANPTGHRAIPFIPKEPLFEQLVPVP